MTKKKLEHLKIFGLGILSTQSKIMLNCVSNSETHEMEIQGLLKASRKESKFEGNFPYLLRKTIQSKQVDNYHIRQKECFHG